MESFPERVGFVLFYGRGGVLPSVFITGSVPPF